MITHIAIDVQDEQEAARILSLLNREHVPHRVRHQPSLTDAEQAAARQRVLQGGSQTLDVYEMAAYIREMSERNLPFRNSSE